MNDTSLSEYSRMMLVMVVLGLLCMTFLLVPVSAGNAGQRLIVNLNKNSVMKGESFSISVIGQPNTTYWVWVKGTSGMSGAIDDQPPMLALSQSKVYRDAPNMNNIYPLGQYRAENFFWGKVLMSPNNVALSDVAMDPTASNRTRYYAVINTSSSGTRTVEFVTTNWTKEQTYTIRVERDANAPNQGNGPFVTAWPWYTGAEVYVNVTTGTPVPALVHTISGTIFNHAPGDKVEIGAFEQVPGPGITPVANVSISSGDQYTISVPPGIYWLKAFADLNSNVQSDSNEPSGFAINKTGQHWADPLFVFHDLANVDMTLTTRPEKPAGTGVNLTYSYGNVNAGTGFSLTVQGQPDTVYWLWVKNGTDMPVDPFWGGYQNSRPPVIIPNQPGVVLDNNVTPVIGNAYVPDGSNQTVYDLVPHGFENGSRYYARVLTNESGCVMIPWETSIETKAQPYTFRVENHSVANANYTFDEAMVKVHTGLFTLLAPGDGSFTLGNEIHLMGASTMTDTVYLFITGPNLWPEGSSFTRQGVNMDPRMLRSDGVATYVRDGIASDFMQRPVYSDNTWDWTWGTAAWALDPGSYTIYAVSAPHNALNLHDRIYANYTFVIKEPFITASADPPVAVKENWGVVWNLSEEWWRTKALSIHGIATGSPQTGVAMWVLGPNYVNRWITQVNLGGNYEFALANFNIMYMSPGRYHVIVQHPMQNQWFDINMCTGIAGSVCSMQSSGGLATGRVFTLLGAGSLNSEEATQALTHAIADPANDDIYTIRDFDVVENGSSPPPLNSINLAPGWNFISVPKKLAAGSDTASAVFAGVDTGGHTIWKYNSSSGAWYNMTAGDPVQPLYGIWIFSTHATTVPLTFDIPQNPQLPLTRTLYPGWNAIGFTGTVPASARDMLSSVDSIWSVLFGFDANHGPYTVIHGGGPAFADTKELSPGNGFWVFVSSPGTLAAIG